MAPAPVRRSPLVNDVITNLRAEITSGRWAVGSRIPPEPALIAQLGVARGTLREAIRSLAHVGLLQVRQGDGTYVRATSELAGVLQRLGSDLDDVLEVRQALDAQSARLAATRITREALADLDTLLTHRAAAWRDRDRDAWVDADYSFHRAVAASTGNALLLEIYTALGPTLRQAMVDHWADEGFNGADARGHEDLLDALRVHDIGRAAHSATVNVDATQGWHATRT